MPYNILGDIQTLTLSNDVQCDNPCCILTINCDVMLMGNMVLTNYTTSNPLATLPESMRITDDTYIPVVLGSNDSFEIVPLHLTADGEFYLPKDVASGTLYTNGLTFNACDQYYNSEIGNNFSQGTSPLRYNEEISNA